MIDLAASGLAKWSYREATDDYVCVCGGGHAFLATTSDKEIANFLRDHACDAQLEMPPDFPSEQKARTEAQLADRISARWAGPVGPAEQALNDGEGGL